MAVVEDPRSIDPLALARRIDDMTLRDLVLLSASLVAQLGMTAEGSGSKLGGDRISTGKAASSAPSRVPVCICNCASLADHHKTKLAAAWSVDAQMGGEPRRLRGAVLRAAQDLRHARHAPDAHDARDTHEDSSERDERIVADYEGMSAHAAAALESARAGHVTAAAVRKARTRNLHDPVDGRPIPEDRATGRNQSRSHGSQQAWALELYHSGKSQTAVAQQLGVAQSTVSRWVRSVAA